MEVGIGLCLLIKEVTCINKTGMDSRREKRASTKMESKRCQIGWAHPREKVFWLMDMATYFIGWRLSSCSFEKFLLTTFIDSNSSSSMGYIIKTESYQVVIKIFKKNTWRTNRFNWIHHAISILLIASCEQKTCNGSTTKWNCVLLLILSCWTFMLACSFSLISWSCSDHYPWHSHVLISSPGSVSPPRPCVWTINWFPFQEIHLIFIIHLFNILH